MRTNVVNAHGFEVSNDHILKPLAQMPPLPPQQVEPIAREQEATGAKLVCAPSCLSAGGGSGKGVAVSTAHEGCTDTWGIDKASQDPPS